MLSSGTGFIINDDGLILTNRHVVADAKTYLVMLDGGVKKSGEIVVIDTDQDLAEADVAHHGPSVARPPGGCRKTGAIRRLA